MDKKYGPGHGLKNCSVLVNASSPTAEIVRSSCPERQWK
jgi:hypothetical protein